MLDLSATKPDLKQWLLAIGDRDEMAWHIIDFGLMHDLVYAEVVAMAATGPGEHSQQLSAMIGHADEELVLPSSSKPVMPPLPAEPYRSRPMSPQEQTRTNPFYRSRS